MSENYVRRPPLAAAVAFGWPSALRQPVSTPQPQVSTLTPAPPRQYSMLQPPPPHDGPAAVASASFIYPIIAAQPNATHRAYRGGWGGRAIVNLHKITVRGRGDRWASVFQTRNPGRRFLAVRSNNSRPYIAHDGRIRITDRMCGWGGGGRGKRERGRQNGASVPTTARRDAA